tara:strand:+ start:4662 stop:4838 length:177 start_codon:yes stop_codon:yes gene_type:complete
MNKKLPLNFNLHIIDKFFHCCKLIIVIEKVEIPLISKKKLYPLYEFLRPVILQSSGIK